MLLDDYRPNYEMVTLIVAFACRTVVPYKVCGPPYGGAPSQKPTFLSRNSFQGM